MVRCFPVGGQGTTPSFCKGQTAIPSMTVNPSEISSTEANMDLANEPAADLDLENIPGKGSTADDPASRAVSRDFGERRLHAR